MLRTSNPLNRFLANSTCFFEFQLPKEAVIRPTSDVVARIERMGGHLVMAGSDVRLIISHETVDAFGGLYLVARLLEEAGVSAGRPLKGIEDGMNSLLKGFVYRHATVEASTPRLADSTFTQALLISLFGRLEKLKTGNVALAVALEPLDDLSWESVKGNSLVLITMPGAKAQELAYKSRAVWTEELRKRGQRTMRVMERRPDLAATEDNLADILVSSIGDTARWKWAPDLNPRQLAMIPTPATAASVNLVLWTRGGVQGLTLCGHPDHWLMQSWDEVRRAWSEVVR